MRLLSVRVGRPTTYPIPGADDPAHDVFTSAIGKQAVTGPVSLGTLGLAGDSVADRRVHGGRDQAVLAYAAAHYPRWREEWGRSDVTPGGFGENLSVDGADEDSVCVGDRWAVGGAVLEVTKPRSPCNTLARYQRREDLISLVRATGRSGWYMRVIEEGVLEAGAPIELLARACPEVTVRRAARAMHERHRQRDEAMLLIRCPALAEDWRLRLATQGFRRDGPASP